jgi:hypothetical protein
MIEQQEPASHRVINTLARKMDDVAEVETLHLRGISMKIDEVISRLPNGREQIISQIVVGLASGAFVTAAVLIFQKLLN